MNEIDNLIEEQSRTLPPNLQKAIETVPWKTLIHEIGKESLLRDEKIVSLEQETMLVIYRFENPRNYVSNLVKELGVDLSKAETLADLVGEKILSVIESAASGSKNLDNEVIQQSFAPTSVPEIAPTNLPVVEPAFAQGSVEVKKGEVVHDVPHEEMVAQPNKEYGIKNNEEKKEAKVALPDYRYEGGKDPYREPLV